MIVKAKSVDEMTASLDKAAALQPLANRIADRSAGGSIERLAGVVGSAAHRRFRLMSAR